MPIMQLEFEVFCSCGNGLCNSSEVRMSRTRGVQQVVVEPCEKCMDEAKDEGYREGRDEE